MTTNEKRCFEAAMHWQRREHLQKFFASLFPRPPFMYLLEGTGPLTHLLYGLVVIGFLPLLLVLWLLRAVCGLVATPYRVILTYTYPQNVKAPGERNIQGIHNAFVPHFDLSPEYYVKCVNDWISILYGDEALEYINMNQLVDISRLEQTIYMPNIPLSQLRNTLTQARETLSKQLGNYT